MATKKVATITQQLGNTSNNYNVGTSVPLNESTLVPTGPLTSSILTACNFHLPTILITNNFTSTVTVHWSITDANGKVLHNGSGAIGRGNTMTTTGKTINKTGITGNGSHPQGIVIHVESASPQIKFRLTSQLVIERQYTFYIPAKDEPIALSSLQSFSWVMLGGDSGGHSITHRKGEIIQANNSSDYPHGHWPFLKSSSSTHLSLRSSNASSAPSAGNPITVDYIAGYCATNQSRTI